MKGGSRSSHASRAYAIASSWRRTFGPGASPDPLADPRADPPTVVANAVTSIIDQDLAPNDIHIGPSDYVPWLKDRKWCHIRMEGTTFGDLPLNLEMKLEVWDSPNSAGIVIDAVRLAKLALNNGISGSLVAPSSYLMKSPHNQRPDDEARRRRILGVCN